MEHRHIYAVTKDNKLINIWSEYTVDFPITVVSPRKYEDQLGRNYASYTLYYDSKAQIGHVSFHHINTKSRDIVISTIYKKHLSYIPIIRPDNLHQVNTISQLMKETL